jgi:histidinol-phosphate aminotransferase
VLKTRASLEKLQPYKPGKPIEELVREYGITGEIIKLASNENPLGASPKALSALSQSLPETHLYPDNDCFALLNRLSEVHDTPARTIAVGNGSVELILNTALVYAEQGSEIIMSDVSFVMYPIAAHIAGAAPVKVPVKDSRHDLEAIVASVNERTRIIYLDNPNNPLGSIVTQAELDAFMDRVPDDVLVVIDEAYHEYVGSLDYPDSLKYVFAGRNVLVLRTFSKIYGLAGLRIGFGFSKTEIVEALNKVRLPFSVSRPGQVAAIAALDDEEHRDSSRALNEQGKVYLMKEFERMKLEYVPPHGNFISKSLEQQGIIVRPVADPKALRVTIGTPEQNAAFIKALEGILAAK